MRNRLLVHASGCLKCGKQGEKEYSPSLRLITKTADPEDDECHNIDARIRLKKQSMNPSSVGGTIDIAGHVLRPRRQCFDFDSHASVEP